MACQIPAIQTEARIFIRTKLPQLDAPLANLWLLLHRGLNLILPLACESGQVLLLLQLCLVKTFSRAGCLCPTVTSLP